LKKKKNEKLFYQVVEDQEGLRRKTWIQIKVKVRKGKGKKSLVGEVFFLQGICWNTRVGIRKEGRRRKRLLKTTGKKKSDHFFLKGPIAASREDERHQGD